MVDLEEERVFTLWIPYNRDVFRDDKEFIELFDYVFINSVLYKDIRPDNTFKMRQKYGSNYGVFTFSIREDRLTPDLYNKYKSELIELSDSFQNEIENYTKFKKFGDIESRCIIRGR